MNRLAVLIDRYRTRPWWRTLVFAFAGGVGFVIDSGVLLLLTNVAHLQVYIARVLSFCVAMTGTWLINRTFTFQQQGPRSTSLLQEWLKYAASSLLGGATNYAAFAIAIAASPFIRAHLIIGVAIGALAGMVTNYLLYSRFVFKTPAQDAPPG